MIAVVELDCCDYYKFNDVNDAVMFAKIAFAHGKHDTIEITLKGEDNEDDE